MVNSTGVKTRIRTSAWWPRQVTRRDPLTCTVSHRRRGMRVRPLLLLTVTATVALVVAAGCEAKVQARVHSMPVNASPVWVSSRSQPPLADLMLEAAMPPAAPPPQEIPSAAIPEPPPPIQQAAGGAPPGRRPLLGRISRPPPPRVGRQRQRAGNRH